MPFGLGPIESEFSVFSGFFFWINGNRNGIGIQAPKDTVQRETILPVELSRRGTMNDRVEHSRDYEFE